MDVAIKIDCSDQYHSKYCPYQMCAAGRARLIAVGWWWLWLWDVATGTGDCWPAKTTAVVVAAAVGWHN